MDVAMLKWKDVPKWHVVCSRHAVDPQPEERIWTVSLDPNTTGWETDCGFAGYGLTRAEASELAYAANHIRYMRHVGVY